MTAPTERYERQLEIMNEAIFDLLGRGMERSMRLPQNGYRRRTHFEGLAVLGEELTLIARTAAFFVRAAGQDLQGRENV
jgi:hypothetical protein